MAKQDNKRGTMLRSGQKPFARFQVEWHQVVPRRGSAFERMAVFTIDRLANSELSGDSLRNVFVNILRVPEETVTLFLKPAVEDLLDVGLGAITREGDGRSPEDSPISSFNLTETGRRLLKEGSLPCPSISKRKAFLVNLEDGTVCGDRNGLRPMDEVSKGRYAHSVTFPEEAMKRYIRDNEISEGSVSDLRSLAAPEFFFGYVKDNGKKHGKKGKN